MWYGVQLQGSWPFFWLVYYICLVNGIVLAYFIVSGLARTYSLILTLLWLSCSFVSVHIAYAYCVSGYCKRIALSSAGSSFNSMALFLVICTFFVLLAEESKGGSPEITGPVLGYMRERSAGKHSRNTLLRNTSKGNVETERCWRCLVFDHYSEETLKARENGTYKSKYIGLYSTVGSCSLALGSKLRKALKQ